MFAITLEFVVSNSERLPQMDMSYNSGKGVDPVSELMRAIILRAIDDYNSSGEIRQEAISYLTSIEDDEHVFSFRAICKHLGMDPEKTRVAIMTATHRISTRRRTAAN